MALEFSSTRKYAPNFDDNKSSGSETQVVTVLKRLTVRDMFAVQKRIRESSKMKDAADDAMELDMNDLEVIEEIWDLVEEILVKYTSGWTNVKDDGVDVVDTKAVIDLCGPENMALPIDVFNELLGFSQGSEDTAKNLEPESVPENSDSGSTAKAVGSLENNGSETVEESPQTSTDSQSSTILEETVS